MFNINIFYYVYCFVSYIERIPQCIKLLKTKKSEDFSIISIVLGFISCTSWLVYALSTMNSIINCILTIVDCGIWFFEAFLVIKYRKGKNK